MQMTYEFWRVSPNHQLPEIQDIHLPLFIQKVRTTDFLYKNDNVQQRITDEMKTMNVIVVIAVAVVLLHGAEATLYTVGDDLGWAIPPGGAATYAAWAAKHSFVVDDELEFDFIEGEQDLALVTKEDYDSCNTADPLYLFQEPTTLQFLESDTFYFTSTLAGHCTKGQKITIYIGASLPPSPSPIPSPSPCPSSAQGFPADALSAKFVSHKIMAKGN